MEIEARYGRASAYSRARAFFTQLGGFEMNIPLESAIVFFVSIGFALMGIGKLIASPKGELATDRFHSIVNNRTWSAGLLLLAYCLSFGAFTILGIIHIRS
jgi:hypothetical protein